MFQILPRIEKFVAHCFSIRLEHSLSFGERQLDELLNRHQEFVLPTQIGNDIIRDNKVTVYLEPNPLHEDPKIYEGPIPEYQTGNPHTAKFKLLQASSDPHLLMTSSSPLPTDEKTLSSTSSELKLNRPSERRLIKSEPIPKYLLPETVFLTPVTGKRKALFIGINYLRYENYRLNGCINDARNVMEWLVSAYPFPRENIHILTDDNSDIFWIPTRANILREFQWLVSDAQKGDSLFFMFAGHGGQILDVDGDEEDGLDETILPCDYRTKGVIIDDEIHDKLVKPLPAGCRLTALMDCCHSGTGMDLPFIHTEIEESSKKGEFRLDHKTTIDHEIIQSKISKADVILFSGCMDDQVTADISSIEPGAVPQGAMTYSFLKIVTTTPRVTYREMLVRMRQIIKENVKRFVQIPQLSTGRPFDVDQLFSL